jgi:hydroxymethylglutaryl-CoA synthase
MGQRGLDVSERGILAFGAYLPRRRLPRKTISDAMAWANPALKAQAKGERAIRGWDEDSLTMAVEAARDCVLKNVPAPDSIVLASTTLPYADRDNAAVVVEALGLNERINTLDMAASMRAGTAAMANALLCGHSSLVIASDCRDARPASSLEMQIGHGAAAMLIGGGDALLARVLAHAAISRDLVDHYRARGDRFDYTVEDRWVRDEGFFKLIPETVQPLLDDAGVAAESIDHVIFPCPARVAMRLCKILGLPESALADDLVVQCGNTGVVHPLLLMAHILEQASARAKILLVGFGQGVDAFLFETTNRVSDYQPRAGVSGYLERRREESSYLRYLAHQGAIPVDWGNRAEFDNRTALTAFYRNRDSVTGFTGGRCGKCGTVQFPRARICVNPQCREFDTQEPVSLSGVKGRVKSFTEDWLAYCPDPPLQYGNVEIEGGGNILMEFADCEPGTLAIGTPVEMRFRIKDVDARRSFTRYFWKPTPVEEK